MLQGEELVENTHEYNEFVEKFKPKKTTDDCYTPPYIYDEVAQWVSEKYAVDTQNFVRPFYPGGDFEHYKYADGCVVVDNPPFSILSKIVRYYQKCGIKFFLFAPTLTLFSTGKDVIGVCYIPLDINIIYENGANISTSFITNLEPKYKIRTAPELYAALREAQKVGRENVVKKLPKYKYPPEVALAPEVGRYNRFGIDFRVREGQCKFIRRMDSQKEKKKSIFGGGFLLSLDAMAEREKAEREKAEYWILSEQEREIMAELAGGQKDDL